MNRSLYPACMFLLILLMAIPVGCSENHQTEVQEVTFEQLLSNPERYNRRYIELEAFYFSGFEIIVLSESLEYSGHAEGHLIPGGRMIWIEGGIPLEVYNKLYQQQQMGPTERYGKIRTRGKFEYGGKYGHLGGYRYQIIPSEAEVLPWSPKER